VCHSIRPRSAIVLCAQAIRDDLGLRSRLIESLTAAGTPPQPVAVAVADDREVRRQDDAAAGVALDHYVAYLWNQCSQFPRAIPFLQMASSVDCTRSVA
jgi:hypothetical protein